eukprot:snap_masked-scaffold_7-processed-gene-4.15-mRNA-1 protein AED:1.00 eAED:1.00 QI:0/0/0/0/1/1/5/0/69
MKLLRVFYQIVIFTLKSLKAINSSTGEIIFKLPPLGGEHFCFCENIRNNSTYHEKILKRKSDQNYFVSV